MLVSSVSRLDTSISKVGHVKMQALIIDHLISKRWERIYLDHLKYELPQDDVNESDPIMLQQYLSNITSKMFKYTRDQLFYAISCDNDPTTIHFMYFPLHIV